MSMENVKKLELGMDMSGNCEKYVTKKGELTRERVQQLINEGLALEEEAMQSGDIDVLERAFDYFLKEEDDIALSNGGCETLMDDIFRYFTMDQVLSVMCKRLDKLIKFNLSRAVQFVGACLNTGNFEEVRNIFNTTKSSKSKGFLDEFEDWYKEDYPKEIEILRKDMQDWDSQLEIQLKEE